MRYFNYIRKEKKEELFMNMPMNIDKYTDREILQYGIGALLYVPAIQKNMLMNCINNKFENLNSICICLEDSVGILGEKKAIENLKMFFDELDSRVRKNIIEKENIPLIFIRPRNELVLNNIISALNYMNEYVTGIVIAKANPSKIDNYISILDDNCLNELYIMPIIETKEFILNSSKYAMFNELGIILKKHQDRILNVRVGATDILGYLKLRRGRLMSVYHNMFCKTLIMDIMSCLNEFNLNIVISGSVCEYYNFLIDKQKESFINEILFEKANGIVGKTVINPNQIKYIQCMSAVEYNDYIDACDIINNINCEFGAIASCDSSRMNEIKPHLEWAKKVLTISKVYGVLNKGISYLDLINLNEVYNKNIKIRYN